MPMEDLERVSICSYPPALLALQDIWAPGRTTAQHGWVQVTMARRTPLVRGILGHGDFCRSPDGATPQKIGEVVS